MSYKAPLVPRRIGEPLDESVEAVRKSADDTAKSAIDAVYTKETTLGTTGGTQVIAHTLGRKPKNWIISSYLGVWPGFTVLSVDAKRITIESVSGAGSKFRLWVS